MSHLSNMAPVHPLTYRWSGRIYSCTEWVERVPPITLRTGDRTVEIRLLGIRTVEMDVLESCLLYTSPSPRDS